MNNIVNDHGAQSGKEKKTSKLLKIYSVKKRNEFGFDRESKQSF